MTTVLCVPQWQGSASERASLLASGAHRTAELLRADTVVTVPVAAGGGAITDGIRAREALVENLRLTGEALAGIDDFVITVGGDCGVDVAPLAGATATSSRCCGSTRIPTCTGRATYRRARSTAWSCAHCSETGPRR